jgi:hypothetical protein
MRSLTRFRPVIVATLLICAAILGTSGAATAAAGPKIVGSAFQSSMKCQRSAGETYCTKNGENLARYTMLRVTGTGFAPHATIQVMIYVMPYGLADKGTVTADASGRIVFNSSFVEVCSSGLPVTITAADNLNGAAAVTTFGYACGF